MMREPGTERHMLMNQSDLNILTKEAIKNPLLAKVTILLKEIHLISTS